MARRITSTLKFLKRLTLDLPRDLVCWVRFYLWRAADIGPINRTLDLTGLSVVAESLPDSDMRLLEEVMNDYDLEGAMRNGGQDTGRILVQGELNPKLRPFIDRFQSIAKDYLNTSRVKLELTYFQMSRFQSDEENVPGGAFHLDDNKPNIKFFVYLSDVGPLNGPFKVIQGSHALKWQKLGRFVKWSLFKRRGDLYADMAAEIDEMHATAVMGPAGFCFAVDTTGWHMAEPVMSGERRVFVCSFNIS